MTNELQTKARKAAQIDVELCAEPNCYAAIPVEQCDTHAKWHQLRDAKAEA